jgi:hypothetical protein
MKRLAIFLMVIGLFPTLAATQVSGFSVTSKPSKPAVTLITSKTGSARGKVNVTVTFTRASTNSRSPLLLTQVKVGKSTCLAVKKSTQCTVKNVKSGERAKVTVRAKNRNGYGSWSSGVSFVPKVGARWILKAPTSSVTGNALRFDFTGAVGLALQETSKSPVSVSSVSKFGSSQSNLVGMTKNGDFFDAVKAGTVKVKEFLIAPNDTIYLHVEGVAVNNTNCVLLAVSVTSGIPDCVESDVNFLFQDGFGDWGGTGTLVPNKTFYQKFQFDDFGGIAYMGIPFGTTYADKTGFHFGGGMATELRYYRSGKRWVVKPTVPFPNSRFENFVTPLRSFLLLRNGSILVDEIDYPDRDYEQACRSCKSQYRFVHYFSDGRRTSVTGFPTGVVRTEPATFISRLPDARIIAGTPYGWIEIDPDRDEIKSQPYLSWSSTLASSWSAPVGFPTPSPSGNVLAQSPLFSVESMNCPVLNDLWGELVRTSSFSTEFRNSFVANSSAEHIYLREICYHLARHWRKVWFANNRLIVLTSAFHDSYSVGKNQNGDLVDVEYQGNIIQAYPTFKPIVTSITSVNVAQPLLNSVFLSGKDAAGANKTILLDLETGVETTLITGLEDLRISKLTLNSVENSVYFGARRLSNNQSVIGKVNLATKKVSILKDMPANLLNIQMFSAASN